MEALVRFELTTSGFVILRSNSVELQSHLDFGFFNSQFEIFGGKQRTRTSRRIKSAAVFRTAARPIWLAFRNADLGFEISDLGLDCWVCNRQSQIRNSIVRVRKKSRFSSASPGEIGRRVQIWTENFGFGDRRFAAWNYTPSRKWLWRGSNARPQVSETCALLFRLSYKAVKKNWSERRDSNPQQPVW